MGVVNTKNTKIKNRIHITLLDVLWTNIAYSHPYFTRTRYSWVARGIYLVFASGLIVSIQLPNLWCAVKDISLNLTTSLPVSNPLSNSATHLLPVITCLIFTPFPLFYAFRALLPRPDFTRAVLAALWRLFLPWAGILLSKKLLSEVLVKNILRLFLLVCRYLLRVFSLLAQILRCHKLYGSRTVIMLTPLPSFGLTACLSPTLSIRLYVQALA